MSGLYLQLYNRLEVDFKGDYCLGKLFGDVELMLRNLHGLLGEELALLGCSEGTLEKRVVNAVSNINRLVYERSVCLLRDVEM